MKDKILFINACVREGSRTLELANCLLDKLNGEVTRVELYNENILPLDGIGLQKRDTKDYSLDEFKYANQFKDADVIVVAAPFWDLSFPSVVKIYFENITISGLTFEYSSKGRPVGKCNAKKLYYVTTAGGYIANNNFGYDYVKALATNFFGIEKTYFYSAEGLDIFGADTQKILSDAKAKISNEI